ncbi:MAG: lipopolysaccharide heptosyltransferase I [Burkholderiaceae bacterium]
MKILIVKLSSLGDVVHTLPALQDIRRAFPRAQIDWVVESGFAPVVQRCSGVNRVIECDLRRWRKTPFSNSTREAWRIFRQQLQSQYYDAVIDAQGLSKSAWVSWLSRMAPGGQRFALANRTDGSSYEAPTRWVADQPITLRPRIHAVQRSRELCAQALGYALLSSPSYGLLGKVDPAAKSERTVVFVHGSSRTDKLWPEAHWVALGQRLQGEGYSVALPHGSEEERQRSEAIAGQLPGAVVWPRLGLAELTDVLAGSSGVIGVDSGLSHIATALDLPHVQIYNFETAWRTGPQSDSGQVAHQRSIFAQPHPAVDAVWQTWQQVMQGRT